MQRLFQSLMFGLTILLFVAGTTAAQTTADREAIKQTALDYIEGYYEGKPERMERSLHPDLAKRIVRTDSGTGKSKVEHMTAERLVQIVQSKKGKITPLEKQQKDVTILDVYENSASVKIVAADWIDYLHVSKVEGKWLIVNVLWEMKPAKN